jgi:hypothetical protein
VGVALPSPYWRRSRDPLPAGLRPSTFPARGKDGREAVARHLGLDDQLCWVKTDEVNRLVWENGPIPHGVSRAPDGRWDYRMMPQALGRQVFEQVREKVRRRGVRVIERV